VVVSELITRERVLAALQRHIGAAAGASASCLVREIVGCPGDASAERALREVIVQLRLEGAHICGHPRSGYFIAASADELNDTCRFLYGRAITSLLQVSRMKNIALPDLEGQLRLRT
jgi:hypothetical protein